MADEFIRYSRKIIFQRVVWNILWNLTIRYFHRRVIKPWEIFILKMLGAKIGLNCTIYPSARILIPSNLIMEDGACLANNTIVQNSAAVTLKRKSIVSQGTYLCCGSHDFTRKDFPNIRKPIVVGENAWIAAQCFVGPGVVIGEGAVVGARAAVFKDVEPWTVVGGNPARFIKKRELSC